MNEPKKDNITPLHKTLDSGHSDDGGDGIDSRLRAVEGDIREIKTNMNHVATKAWVLGGVLGGMGIAAGIATGIASIIYGMFSK